MAKKLYDEKITKATDWGGDESTGGLPVSGRRVQEFIKGELGRRYGYSRVADEKFLQQFESEEAARLYDEDPERYADLLLSTVQLPGTGETVAIMRVTVLQTPAEYTTEGVTEVFGFRYLSYYKDEVFALEFAQLLASSFVIKAKHVAVEPHHASAERRTSTLLQRDFMDIRLR